MKCLLDEDFSMEIHEETFDCDFDDIDFEGQYEDDSDLESEELYGY